MNKSQEMKKDNAKAMKLSPLATGIYLQGLASLSKCEQVAKLGNKSQGFILR